MWWFQVVFDVVVAAYVFLCVQALKNHRDAIEDLVERINTLPKILLSATFGKRNKE